MRFCSFQCHCGGARAGLGAASILSGVLVASGMCPGAEAALVAQYTFESSDATDSSGSTNAYDLTATGGTAAPVYASEIGNTFVRLAGSNGGADGQILETAAGALEANDDDGNGDWIVSLWFRTDDWTQGSFRGLLSTSRANNASRGWQLDSNGGAGRVVYNDDGSNFNDAWSVQPTVDEWHHLYVKKTNNTTWEIYLDEVLVSDSSEIGNASNQNLGRVDEIRLGTIRNGVNSLRADYDYIQVWDGLNDAGSDLNTVFADGQAHLGIPEPSSLALLALGGLAMVRRR